MNKNAKPSPPIQPLPVQGTQARMMQYDNPPTQPANPGVAENVDARLLQAQNLAPVPEGTRPAPTPIPQMQPTPPAPTTKPEPIPMKLVEYPRPGDPTDAFGNAIPEPSSDDQLRPAVIALLTKMQEVAEHPEFQAVWQNARNARILTGAMPTWGPELRVVKELCGL
jgi:hypothetical protein